MRLPRRARQTATPAAPSPCARALLRPPPLRPACTQQQGALACAWQQNTPTSFQGATPNRARDELPTAPHSTAAMESLGSLHAVQGYTTATGGLQCQEVLPSVQVGCLPA